MKKKKKKEKEKTFLTITFKFSMLVSLLNLIIFRSILALPEVFFNSRNHDVITSLYAFSSSWNISNTRKSVFSDFQTPRSRLERRGAADFFNQLRGVWNRRKRSSECLI